jgi:hypothetical protein
MDEQRKEDGSDEQRKTKEPRRIEPAELVAAIDSCLVCYRLAVHEAELTSSFCRDHRPIKGLIETVKVEKDFLEEQQRELEKARVSWGSDQLRMARAILDMDEETISTLPQDEREILLSYCQDATLDEELTHCLDVVERNNSMLRQVTKVLWGLRWEDEERVESLLESLQKKQTEPSRPADILYLAQFLIRRGEL